MGPGGAAQGLGHPVSFSRLALSGAKAKARVPNHLLLRVSHLHIRVKYVGESRYHLVGGWQFRLENKHAKTCRGTSWISHDLPPESVKTLRLGTSRISHGMSPASQATK